MPLDTQKRSMWLGIAERVVSFGAIFAVAFIWVGSTRQKVQQKVSTLETEMAQWKEEWKAEHKHITEMDLEGSVATKNFVTQYEVEQAKQYKRLEKMEDQVSHFENMKYRIERLERELERKTNAP